MSKQTTGWILVIVGLVLALLAITADYIRLGAEEGMGYRQIVLLVIGVLVAVVGLVLCRRKS